MFQCNAASLAAPNGTERSHVVQSVAKFDSEYAPITPASRDNELAQRGLFRASRASCANVIQFGDAINNVRNHRAETAFNVADSDIGIFHNVMQ